MAHWRGDVEDRWHALTRDKYERLDRYDQQMLRWLFENPRSHKCLAGLAKFMGVTHVVAYNRLAHLALSGVVELVYPTKKKLETPRGAASGYIRIKVSAHFWEQLVGVFGQEVTA